MLVRRSSSSSFAPRHHRHQHHVLSLPRERAVRRVAFQLVRSAIRSYHTGRTLLGNKETLPQDPWKALGLQQGDSFANVKKAYTKLVKQYHPDVAGGEQEKFIEIQKAFETIQSMVEDGKYDETLVNETPEMRDTREKKEEEEEEREKREFASRRVWADIRRQERLIDFLIAQKDTKRMIIQIVVMWIVVILACHLMDSADMTFWSVNKTFADYDQALLDEEFKRRVADGELHDWIPKYRSKWFLYLFGK